MLLTLLRLLPRKALSHFTGIVVHIEKPKIFADFIKSTLIKSFNINTAEAERSVDSYPSFGKFFARRLKPETRPLAEAPFVMPCDGKISEFGPIEEGYLTQCKGINYSVEKLLKDSNLVSEFQEGFFITVYLAPYNYHRVHLPASGKITHNYTIEGDLWPVNNTSVEEVDELFCVNERKISILETDENQRYALIMVGATNVGSIELDDSIYLENNVPKGNEYGTFHMGSTVILLLNKDLRKKVDTKILQRGNVTCLEALLNYH